MATATKAAYAPITKKPAEKKATKEDVVKEVFAWAAKRFDSVSPLDVDNYVNEFMGRTLVKDGSGKVVHDGRK